MVIMIRYAPKIQIYTLFMKRNEALKLLKIIHVMQHRLWVWFALAICRLRFRRHQSHKNAILGL